MIGDNQQSPESDQLDHAVKAMQMVDVPEVPEEIVRLTGLAIGQASRRRRWQRRSLQGATAAIIALVLVSLAYVIVQTNSSTALADDVAQQMRATKTLRAVVIDPRDGGRLFLSGTRRRFEGEHSVIIADLATGKEVMLDTKSKSAYRIPRQEMNGALDIYAMIRELATAASTPIKEHIDKAGKRFPGFAGNAALKVGGDRRWNVEVKVWTDPKRKLPVRIEIRPTGRRGEVMLIEQIEFDVPLDDAIFDMTIPAEYSLVGLSADQLKPPPSKQEAAKLTIVPGIGMGEVEFGMSRKQIVAHLGEPEFTMHEVYLCYPSKGLQLVLVGREPDKLGMIIANPWDAASRTRNVFPGQTSKGIRIGSTLQEVHDAYGEPDPPVPDDGRSQVEVARYGELGLQFGFSFGNVQQIIAGRTD